MEASDSIAPVTFTHSRMEAQRAAFQGLARAYHDAWGLACVLTDVDGNVVNGDGACTPECVCTSDCAAARKRAIEEAVRWGEPSVLLCPHENLIWAVPVMENACVLGGIVAARTDIASLHRRAHAGAPGLQDIHLAVTELRDRAAGANLTNAALL